MSKIIEQFRNAIRTTGMEPPAVIKIREHQTFPGIGKRKGNTAGGCKFWGEGGYISDGASGLFIYWNAESDSAITEEIMNKFKEQRIEGKKDQKKSKIELARKAKQIWEKTEPAPSDHRYIVSMKIKVNGARLDKKELVLPVLDMQFKIKDLHYINILGQEWPLGGEYKKGRFIHVCGCRENPSKVVICEGWATGCSLAESEPDALVLAVIETDNLKSVAMAAREKWPDAELIIAADDDRETDGNPGLTRAKEAARASDALIIKPSWPNGAPSFLTNFNELEVWFRPIERDCDCDCDCG